MSATFDTINLCHLLDIVKTLDDFRVYKQPRNNLPLVLKFSLGAQTYIDFVGALERCECSMSVWGSGYSGAINRSESHLLSTKMNTDYTVIPLYRGSVHSLQDVALRITSPVVSLSGISAPSDSFHLHDVVSPSLRLSTS